MHLEEAILTRYSARRFIAKSVPHDTIVKILETAQHTPSWCNTQPWQVVLLSGKAMENFRAALFDHARGGAAPNPDFPFPQAYLGVYRDRRKVCGVQLYQSLGIGKDDRRASQDQTMENFRMFGAPHLAMVTTDEALGVYGALDCGLYAATFMYTAKGMGVDTIAQAALASYPDFIRSYLGLGPQRKVVFGIAFGYADEDHPVHGYRTERAGINDVVTFLE